jgi:four helix bundle protein
VISLGQRTKAFSVRIIRLYSALPRGVVAQILGKQMLRSGTSVGAHCREAFRSRSDAEWISKLEVGLQELGETLYWLELLVEAEIMTARRLAPLMQEIDELTGIMVASLQTVKRRRRK